jgi:hypothetical protein
MKSLTRRDRLVGGAILVLLAAMVPRLIEWTVAYKSTTVMTEILSFRSAQIPRQAASIAANERAVLEDIRKVIRAQAAYRAVNHGFYEGRLECLVSPQECIPFYPSNAPSFLDSRLATLGIEFGYKRSFTAGPGPISLPAVASPTSALAYRYDAWPATVGFTGVRGFAADATGRICFTPDGTRVSEVTEGKLPRDCTPLERFEPKAPSASAASRPPSLPGLRVRKASVEPNEGLRLGNEPLYSFRVELENASARPLVLVGVRRVFFAPGAAESHSDTAMACQIPIAPGAIHNLGGDEATALSNVGGLHFLVLSVRFGDAEDYRTNRGQTFVFKWAGTTDGVVPRELQTAPKEEAARVRKEAFARGGWWGGSGP